MAQPGDRQEILGKLSIPCVALLSLYSPECVEGEFCEFAIVAFCEVRAVSPPLRWYLPTHEADTNTPALRHGTLGSLTLVVGCGGGGSQGQGGQKDHTTHHQSANVKLTLHPEHHSGVRGTASFEDTSDGVAVKLDLRNLPKANTFYLAHIHPGTCAGGDTHEHGSAHGEEGHGHEHGGGTHEHGGADIEYPLSQVKSDSEGHGSSTTTLPETSVDMLFSAEPKYVNVHEAGSGDPPILSCADLKRAG